jgi:hypothetical protein
VVQTTLAGGADVHAGTFADSFEALEDLDRPGTVGVLVFLLLGSHGRTGLLGVSQANDFDNRPLVLQQSTVNPRPDRFCGGVSTHLVEPCAEFLGSAYVITLDAHVGDLHVAVSRL